MSERKVLGVMWFTTLNATMGLVLMNNGHEEKAYLGVVPGGDMDADTEWVLDNGTRFPTGAARMALGMPPS